MGGGGREEREGERVGGKKGGRNEGEGGLEKEKITATRKLESKKGKSMQRVKVRKKENVCFNSRDCVDSYKEDNDGDNHGNPVTFTHCSGRVIGLLWKPDRQTGRPLTKLLVFVKCF